MDVPERSAAPPAARSAPPTLRSAPLIEVQDADPSVERGGYLISIAIGVGLAAQVHLLLGVAVGAGLSGLVWLAMRHVEPIRLQWDGSEVWMNDGRTRFSVARAGEGEVRRYTSRRRSGVVGTQVWFDGEGRETWRFVESNWDAAQLERIRMQAGIPLSDVGQLTPAQVATAGVAGPPRNTLPVAIAVGLVLVFAVGSRLLS